MAEEQLGNVCVLAYDDVAGGASLQALQALEAPGGCSVQARELALDGWASPVRLLRWVELGGATRASLLLLPAAEAGRETQAAAAALRFAAAASRLVLAAAMRFPALLDDAGTVRALAFNGASSRKRPGFPATAPVPCGVLAALLHLSRAAGTPTLALLAPAHRSLTAEEAGECARILAVAICGELGCGFASSQLSAGGQSTSAARQETSLMYC
jgi:hypothetical protein